MPRARTPRFPDVHELLNLVPAESQQEFLGNLIRSAIADYREKAQSTVLVSVDTLEAMLIGFGEEEALRALDTTPSPSAERFTDFTGTPA